MENGATGVVDAFKELLTKSIEGNVQFLNGLAALAREGPRAWSSSLLQRPLPKSSEVVARLLELNVAYYTAWTRHSLGFLNDLASATEKALGIAAPPARRDAQPRAEINVAARQGEKAVGSFLVENSYDHALEVSLHPGEIVSCTGHAIKSPAVTFDPPSLTLSPRSHALVHTIVEITKEFRTGETYMLPVALGGFAGKEVCIFLNISAAEPAPPEPVASPPKKRGRSKRR